MFIDILPMTILEAIEERRAIFPKQFSGNEVPHKVLEEMLQAANWAPTHKRTEPWRFVVFSKTAKDQLLDYFKERYVKTTPSDKFNSEKIEKIEQRKTQVSNIIAIVSAYNPDLLPEFEETSATAMAVQNMWLYLASTKNYGGYWSSPAYCLDDEFHKYLDLSENEKCLGVFYVGTVANETTLPKGQRGDWKEKVTFKS